MFCINFAFAGIITAIISIFWGNLSELIWIFLILSVLSIFFVKPILVKLIKKETSTDFDSQYIGKIVKVIEPITKTKGAVTIYDERWEARLQYDTEEIPVDSDVKIVANDSLILFVEKV
jgi:membrane protein implicated in regulation of membrane protease activity